MLYLRINAIIADESFEKVNLNTLHAILISAQSLSRAELYGPGAG